jgi:hypothetical protein
MLTGARRCRIARITLGAWLALAAFDLASRLGFARLHAWIRRCPPANAGRRRAVTPDEIVWAVDEACVWYVKRAMCLQRSVVATWLLRRHGWSAELVIGCRPLPFESHAWVELDGRVVNDRQQYRTAFTVLDRL